MRPFAGILTVVTLAAFAMTPAARAQSGTEARATVVAPDSQKASTDSVVHFLIVSAATDFHSHGPSGPLHFREVLVGHVKSSSGEATYFLSGKFLRGQGGDNAVWTPFLTIKTSGYEQYVGKQAATYFQDSPIVWDRPEDLSSLLQSQLDAFQ